MTLTASLPVLVKDCTLLFLQCIKCRNEAILNDPPCAVTVEHGNDRQNRPERKAKADLNPYWL